MKVRVGPILALALAGYANASEWPRDGTVSTAAASRCRMAFQAVAANPSARGGWLLDVVAGQTIVCLYGNVAGVGGLELALHGERVDWLVLRSTGGPVPVWLGIAELLAGSVDRAFVDDACFSSCANYAFPLAQTVEASEGSLIVWHGGPTLAGLDAWAKQVSELAELIEYHELAVRTSALYERLGIDTAILTDSEQGPVAARPRPIDGYAFPPAVLAMCYGFDNVAGLWHAGDDDAVHALGRQRSAGLDLLATPGRDCQTHAPPRLLLRNPG